MTQDNIKFIKKEFKTPPIDSTQVWDKIIAITHPKTLSEQLRELFQPRWIMAYALSLMLIVGFSFKISEQRNIHTYLSASAFYSESVHGSSFPYNRGDNK